MSTIVFQNRASPCFESLLSETTTTTTTLKLKVAAPPPPESCEKLETDIDHPTNLEFGNWGFLQTAPKETGDYYTECDNYTHCPWAKKSSFSILSPKSLELCTENLGSETGSDVITEGDADIFSSSNSCDYAIPHYKRAESDGNWKRRLNSQKKPNRSFPPPLTTMSGAASLQVRRRREGGRLIIEAVEAPFMNSYLQAERSDGRLRLSFLTAEATTSAAAREDDDDDEWDGESAAEEEEIEEAQNEVELDQSKEEIEFDEGIINNNNNNLEMEMEKYQWLSRCKEEGGHGNEGLCRNWKPAFWVAIS